MLTSQSDGTTTQTGLPSTSTISVLSTRAGSTPSDSAACSPMLLGVGIVDVSVKGELHAQSIQHLGCAGGFGHCRSVVDKC